MKKVTIYCLMALLASACVNTSSPGSIDESESSVSVLSFSFDETVAEVTKMIQRAEKTIDISLYKLEEETITEALVEAHEKRGVQVRVSTEFDSESLFGWQRLHEVGVPIQLGNDSGIQHNKFMIVDSKFILTGSTNFSESGPGHFNNAMIIRSKAMAADFQRDFDVQFKQKKFAGNKDQGYYNLYGNGSFIAFPETAHRMSDGKMTIQPYFTPYQKTFLSYKRVDNTGAETSGDTCQAINVPCTGSNYCGDQGVRYQFFNLQSLQDECQNFNHGLNILIDLIENAQKSIFVLAFAFTDKLTMDRLIKAQERGLEVKVWMDRNQYYSSQSHSGVAFTEFRKRLGFFKICRPAGSGNRLLHHKVIVIDDSIIILGSLNFSANAVNNNDENFVVIKNAPAMAHAFRQEAAKIDEFSFFAAMTTDGNDTEESQQTGGNNDL